MKKDNKPEQGPENPEIPGMEIDRYSAKKPLIPESSEKIQKELEKTKKELEKLKISIVKKYPFTQAIGILPPQAIKDFIEEEVGENVPEEELKKLQKKVHLYIIIPEDKLKEIPKIKKEIISEIERTKQNVWIYVKTPVDIWEACLDSKFELVSAIGMSFPLHDKGFLGALRVAEIHKSLVLQKFDKYVVSYVISGSFLRGTATKTSDVDVFIIINDTDVKRMPRLELKERLRGMIYQYVAEAAALAGVKNTLHIQTYLLTEFWDSVKDAHPVIFTFIRDGIPLYDRATFLPWKVLLKMGKLKPTPEAIDMFMKTAEKTGEFIERRLLEAMVDLYYKVLNPSQALIMLYGVAPPTHKETPKLVEDIFVKKEKMLKKSEVAILTKLVGLFKKYEHDSNMKIKGSEIDQLVKDSDVYIERLKELRKQIEKRSQEKTIEQIHKDIFNLLEAILGKKSQATTVLEFEKLMKKGKFTQQHLKILRDVIKAKTEFKRGKLDAHKVDNARKNASILINELIDYSQRSDLVSLEKGRMRLRYKKAGKDMAAELLHCNGASFLFAEGNVKKITNKIENSDMKEVSDYVGQQKSKKGIEIHPKVFELVKKELGDFEIVL